MRSNSLPGWEHPLFTPSLCIILSFAPALPFTLLCFCYLTNLTYTLGFIVAFSNTICYFYSPWVLLQLISPLLWLVTFLACFCFHVTRALCLPFINASFLPAVGFSSGFLAYIHTYLHLYAYIHRNMIQGNTGDNRKILSFWVWVTLVSFPEIL